MRLLCLPLLMAACVPAPAPGIAPDLQLGDTVRMVAVGDSGRDTEGRTSLFNAMGTVCAQRGCDLGVVLGDNLYDRGMVSELDPEMDRMMAPFLGAGFPWYLVSGNHDYAHGRDHQRAAWGRAWAQRTEGFEHPAPWYRFDAGPAAFFALDTTWSFWNGSGPQRRWLLDELEASQATWKVVFGHHPLRSNGSHGNVGAYEGWANVPYSSGARLEPLLQGVCGRADFYLSGHDHNLQELEHCGTRLVVSGSSATVRPVVDRGNDPLFQAGVMGFAWITLGETASVAFFDEHGALLHESGAIDPDRVLY